MTHYGVTTCHPGSFLARPDWTSWCWHWRSALFHSSSSESSGTKMSYAGLHGLPGCITSVKSPWYNRTSWLGIKHQLTYLLTLVKFLVFVDLSESGGWPLTTHQTCWCCQTCDQGHPWTPSATQFRTCTCWASHLPQWDLLDPALQPLSAGLPADSSSLRQNFTSSCWCYCRTVPTYSLWLLPCYKYYQSY